MSASHGEATSRRDSPEPERYPSVAQFVSQASHDLKTPLAAITGYAVTLERRGDSLDQSLKHEMLDHIRGAATRMQMAVEQLVEYARLELGILECEPETVDVSEVIREVAVSAREAAPDAKIEVEGGGPHLGKADRGRLSRAVSALLENALRHGRARARVLIASTEQFVTVRVEDGGGGIPDGLEDLVFSADLEARPRSGQPRGLGIELHNARRIMRLQGGDLRLVAARSSGDYPGAVFELKVPKADTVPGEASGDG